MGRLTRLIHPLSRLGSPFGRLRWQPTPLWLHGPLHYRMWVEPVQKVCFCNHLELSMDLISKLGTKARERDILDTAVYSICPPMTLSSGIIQSLRAASAFFLTSCAISSSLSPLQADSSTNRSSRSINSSYFVSTTIIGTKSRNEYSDMESQDIIRTLS